MSLQETLEKGKVIPFQPNEPQPPHNIEAEQALLGAIFINNDAFYRVSDFLEARHFYEPIHERIFEVLASTINAGKIATPVTIKGLLPLDSDVAGMSPAIYLARLAAEATSVINAADYGRSIRELSTRRDLMALSAHLASRAADCAGPLTVHEIIEEAEGRLIDLTSIDAGRGGFEPFTQPVKEAVNMAAAAYQRDGGLSGIATGIGDLDRMMGGLQNSDLVVIAARPGMGKTALATNIAYSIAADYRGQPRPDGTIETVSGGIVGFFSLEMSGEQLATRIIADKVEIPSSRIRRGDIGEEEFTRIAGWAQVNANIPLYVDQTGGLSIAQIISRARRLRRQRGVDVLIVDYIQLLSGTARHGFSSNRVSEMTEITTKLKALAKELGIPVIALSQLSRAVESRDDKRPQLSDLRESGSIEQDADVVMFVYREEYYLKNREPADGTEEWFKWEAAMKGAENRADIIIGKQRHGPTGTVELRFDPQLTRFGNIAREERMPERRGS